jgi:type III secretion protein Q
MLASAWERSERQAYDVANPSFLLAARVATSSVSRSGLRGLAEGDALLFDRVAPDGGVVLTIGEALTAVGQIAENGDINASAAFSANNPLSLGEFLMSDTDFETDGGAAALDDAAIGALPVRLVFEIGRREVSLDELRDMAVGTPIPLDKPASSVVDILANGRRVGSGEMVLIGDQLGVKITRLNGHAA